MKVALFGATGAVGGYFLTKALAVDHQVTALVRSPEKLAEHPNLCPAKVDATDPSDVRKTVAGNHVAVSCLGNVKGALIMENAAEALLETAAAQPEPLPLQCSAGMGTE